jgi:Ca2+-binding EF-hand superfamily protein
MLGLGSALAQTPATSAKAPSAASPAKQPRSKGEEQALKWFSILDTNGDGRISRQEAEVGIRLRPSLANDFRAADLNGDGYLTQSEIRTVADRRRVERQARRERERTAAVRSPSGNPAR